MKNLEGTILSYRRLTAFCLVFTLAMSLAVPINVYAAPNSAGTPSEKNISQTEKPAQRRNIEVYLRPDVTISYKGEDMAFFDAKSMRVYPLIYNGATYLPIRALSGLLKKPIDWDGPSKGVFMGKTFDDPAGATSGISTSAIAIKNLPISTKPKPKATPSGILVTATIRPDVFFVYNFENRKFYDAKENELYPITYQDSTYLPLRNVSELIKKEIVWDPVMKMVSICPVKVMESTSPGGINGEGTSPGGISGGSISPGGIGTVEEIVTDAAIEQMQSIFQREKEIYNDVSFKIVKLVQTKDADSKETIAKSISEDYLIIGKLVNLLKLIDQSKMTKDQLETLQRLNDFSISFEMYALIIENVAYMNVNNQDFSLLSETLLYYALDSQQKMDMIEL